ncbi:MAG: cytochrome c oxidase subunit 3 [Bermanella sp.]|nr:cytochrome c oxidase subunit 3 [Bermanella sp.]
MNTPKYYVPARSHWPIFGAVAVFLTLFSMASIIHESSQGSVGTGSVVLAVISGFLMLYMLFGWFGEVVNEGLRGLNSDQLKRSFRFSMGWFIFSEVMFFAAFFGALFYARMFAVPWLGGEGAKGEANMLWEGFTAHWPLLTTPDMNTYPGAMGVIDAWKLPFINTVLLIISSVTLTFAHHSLRAQNKAATLKWIALTLALGVAFMCVQIYEYGHAMNDLNLTLNSGIYGSTFFMLTGFHGAHVTLGAIMIFVMYWRVKNDHFTPDDHFGFEAAAWYWHFVDVVWLLLFTFVYVF